MEEATYPDWAVRDRNGIPLLDGVGSYIKAKGCNSRELSTPQKSTSYPLERTKGASIANISSARS